MSDQQDILGFSGDYRWLSNFWPAYVQMDGVKYPSVENAYQASKAVNLADRVPFATCEPAEAKNLGRRLSMRGDWNAIRVSVMTNMTILKYFQHDELRAKLIATGSCYIEETNHWNDCFWGVCNGQGNNMLGKILMAVRQKFVDIRK